MQFVDSETQVEEEVEGDVGPDVDILEDQVPGFVVAFELSQAVRVEALEETPQQFFVALFVEHVQQLGLLFQPISIA